MGQRTAILLKKNYGNNRSTITLIHHQWGIGKTMPAYLMQEVLNESYPLNRKLEYIERGRKLPIDLFYTFKPLNNSDNNYITDKEVKTDDKNEDIWDSNVRVRYGNMTDNNNGLMLIEVTQKYDSNGNAETYGNRFDVKVGFALGYEEISYYNDKLNRGIPIESEFVRLVDMQEYVTRTWRDDEYTREFIQACRTVMKLGGVEEVYDEEGAKEVEDKRNHIHNCITALTKDLPEGQTIDVPKEFLVKDKYYV